MFGMYEIDAFTRLLIESSEEFKSFKKKMIELLGNTESDYYQMFIKYKFDTIEREMIKKAEQESVEVLQDFVKFNDLDITFFKYVNDSGHVPIYTFDGSRIDFNNLVPPKEYIMQRNTFQDGSYIYQLSKKYNSFGFNITAYNIYIYFIDEKDWKLDN